MPPLPLPLPPPLVLPPSSSAPQRGGWKYTLLSAVLPLAGLGAAMAAFSFDDSVRSAEGLFWLHALSALVLLPLCLLAGMLCAVAAVRTRSRGWVLALPVLVCQVVPVAYMVVRMLG